MYPSLYVNERNCVRDLPYVEMTFKNEKYKLVVSGFDGFKLKLGFLALLT